MKNVEKILVQRDRKRMRQGWAARISVAALGASFLLAALAPTPARADGAAVTQLQYLQWLAQSSGAQFNAGSSASAYVNWAVSTGLNPTSSGGWVPNAALSKDVLAQTLVQKFGLTQNKFGGDHARTLARQGLDLSNIGDQVNRDNLAGLVDQFSFQGLAVLTQAGIKAGNNDPGQTQAPPKPKDDGNNDHHGKDGKKDGDHKTTICHKGHTINVDDESLQKHLQHGDTLGACHVTKHGHDRDDDDDDEHHDH